VFSYEVGLKNQTFPLKTKKKTDMAAPSTLGALS